MKGERGMSLVEATIILMVLATLTAVIAPTASTFIEDARGTTAKEEVEAIGLAIVQMLNDTGSRCLRIEPDLDCEVDNRVDLLVSSGSDPTIELASAPDIVLPDASSATESTVNWLPDDSAPSQQDLLEDQLIENDNPQSVGGGGTGYAVPTFTNGGGPRSKVGWRGAYLNGPITGDPWSGKYQVNTLFLTVGSTADFGGSAEGLQDTGWNRDVLVLSPGSNRSIQTSFGSSAVVAGGDDIIYVIKGSTR